MDLKNTGGALFEDADFIDEVASGAVPDEAFGGLMEGLIPKPEGAEMHRNEGFCVELNEGIERLFWVHVNIPLGWGVVGSDGKEGDFHGETLANFTESLEICAVAAVEDRAAGVFDMEASKAAVGVVQDSGTPVAGGGKRDFELTESEGLPVG